MNIKGSSISREKIDGLECLTVSYGDELFSVCPELNYALVRRKVVFEGTDITKFDLTCSNFFSPGRGLFFPRSIQQKVFAKFSEKPELHNKVVGVVVYRMPLFSFELPAIDMFRPDFPDGFIVVDKIRGMNYQVSASSSLGKGVSEAKTLLKSKSWKWADGMFVFVIAICSLILVVGFVAFWRIASTVVRAGSSKPKMIVAFAIVGFGASLCAAEENDLDFRPVFRQPNDCGRIAVFNFANIVASATLEDVRSHLEIGSLSGVSLDEMSDCLEKLKVDHDVVWVKPRNLSRLDFPVILRTKNVNGKFHFLVLVQYSKPDDMFSVLDGERDKVILAPGKRIRLRSTGFAIISAKNKVGVFSIGWVLLGGLTLVVLFRKSL